NGLSRTVQSDLDGNGTIDLTTSDVTVINADGSRTETVTDRNGDGSLLDQSTTIYGADGRSRTVPADSNGDGVIDHLETIVVAADDSSVDTVTDTNANGSLRDKTVTTASADGLSRTIQQDSTGDGAFDLTRSDVTVFNADGSHTETITDRNANGSLRDRTIATVSADGLSRTTQSDIFGHGAFDDT